MFMAYQPHLYERDRRVEKDKNKDKDSNRTPQAGSTAAFVRRSSYDPSLYATASTATQSSDGHEERRGRSSLLQDGSGGEAMVMTTSGSGLLGKLIPISRSKSNGRPRAKAQHDNSTSKAVGSQTTPLLPSASSSSPSVHQSLQIDNAPPLPTSNWTPMRAVDAVRGRTSSHASIPSNVVSTDKGRKTKRKSARPSTANGNMQSVAGGGRGPFLKQPSASRSEEDLAGKSTEEKRETLIDEWPSFSVQRNIHHLDGLRISINQEEDEPRFNKQRSSQGRWSNADLSQYPLPVRLRLITPEAYDQAFNNNKSSSSSSSYSATESSGSSGGGLGGRRKVQLVEGYYLCTPPPLLPVRNQFPQSPFASSPRTTFSPRHQQQPHFSPSYTPSISAFPASPSSSTPVSPLRPQRERLRPPLTSAEGFDSPLHSASPKGEPSWRLEDYFDVQRVRRPGHFGFKERKAHAYPIDEAPYPWGYGPDSIMADVLLHLTVERIVGPTIFKTWDGEGGTPRRVLDIGCGVGHWVMDMAKQWPDAEFVGLDLVPIQKDLRNSDQNERDDEEARTATDLQRRISWVVANVLDGLPFPDASFDFVHIRALNDGVPERKWPKLLTEVTRVLTKKGKLEMLEFDYTFFGSPHVIRTADVMNLILGTSNSDAPPSMDAMHCWSTPPKSRAESQAWSRNAAMDTILRQALTRRGINLNPTSILPFYLSSLDNVTATSHSDLRQLPVLAQSHRKTFANVRPSSSGGRSTSTISVGDPPTTPSSLRTSLSASTAGVKETEEVNIDALLRLNYVEGSHAFSSGMSSKANVPDIHFVVQDLDALRMALLQSDVLRVSDNRHVLWQEVERLRKQTLDTVDQPALLLSPTSRDEDSLLSMSSPKARHRKRSDARRPKTKDGNPSSAATSKNSFAAATFKTNLDRAVTRWTDVSSFERDIDRWQGDMQDRADVDSLIRHKMRWGDAAMRMDGWQASERLRKQQQRNHAGNLFDEKAEQNDAPLSFVTSSDVSQRSNDALTDDKLTSSTPHSASSRFPSGLQDTTEILGLRTGAFYIVSKQDTSSISDSPGHSGKINFPSE